MKWLAVHTAHLLWYYKRNTQLSVRDDSFTDIFVFLIMPLCLLVICLFSVIIQVDFIKFIFINLA